MKKGACIFLVIILLAIWFSSCSTNLERKQAVMDEINTITLDVFSMQLDQEVRRRSLEKSRESGDLTQEGYEVAHTDMCVQKRNELIEKANSLKAGNVGESKEYKILIDAYIALFNVSYEMSIFEEKYDLTSPQYLKVLYRYTDLTNDVLKKKKSYLKSEGIPWEQYLKYNRDQNRISEAAEGRF